MVIGFFAYQARFSRGLQLVISAPEQVLIGVPFDLRVNAANNSGGVLENVRLSLALPDGVAFVGSPQSKTIDFRELNNLGAGGLNQQSFKLIALDGENSFKKITAGTTYLASSLSSRFEKEVSSDLSVGGYGITVDLVTPEKVFGGEVFDSEISFKNISEIDFSDLRLKMEYPLTYTMAKATLNPDIGNNVWVLGGLLKGSEMKFKISGSLLGPEGASFDLKAIIESTLSGQAYPISSNVAAISIAESPVAIKILLNNDSDHVAGLGDSLSYKINYVNNTDVGLRDVIVKVQLNGTMFDLGSISTNGVFRSSDNTLTWNAATTPALQTLTPGESGSVDFSIRTKSVFPIKRLSDKNFILKVSATIESPTVPHFVESGKTVSYAVLESKVGGVVDLDARAYFRDAESGILNKGPMPLKVNQPTQFTIHWVITNYSTDIKDVKIKSFLGGNVRMTGVIKSNGSTIPTYNDRTQEVVWEIPKVPATTGLVAKPLEAIFQVEATPASIDIGRTILLIQDSQLSAVDEFTMLELSDKDSGITTQLPDDPTVGGQGTVTQ